VLGLSAPARAADGAEVELTGDAISREDGAALFGYRPIASPDLVSADDAEDPLGPHGDHEDVRFTSDRLYRNGERVNAERGFGDAGTARGEIEAGHSIAVTSGWADAGRNELGGYAEANAGSLGASTGGAVASLRIEKRITIEPGTSGLAPGTLVTGLLWELGGRGFLEVSGRTHPSVGASSAGCDLDLLVLRGPTGTCGPFDCPNGALAVAASLLTGFSFQATDPNATAGGRTGLVTRNRSWSASHNTEQYKAGGVFESGSDGGEVGLPITEEDVWVSRVEGVHTAGEPLALDAIEFEANVGETLRVTMDLDVSGAVQGAGSGQADFFDSFAGGVRDPQARGLVFATSVPVPEPPPAELARVAALALLIQYRRCARRGRPASC
jgi:hypothetical protein